ncbi:MAG: HEAT repeat domain-containing protein [Ruminiclostridium sp.]
MNTTAEELRLRYEQMKESGFPLDMVFDFGKMLGDSNELDLHFELYVEDQRRPRSQQWHPEDFFRLHREPGLIYLSRLLTSDNTEYAVLAAYLMAEILPRGRYDGQEQFTSDLIKALVRLAQSEQSVYRRKCIIALGWVGTEKEIPLLQRHLLTDEDPLCRAWSASSFLQMSGRVPSDIIKEQTYDALLACFEQETDIFVRGVAVETVQAVWDVKLGIRSSAVDDRNKKAIERAVSKAVNLITAERLGKQA